MALSYSNALSVPYLIDGAQKKVVYDVTLDSTSDPSSGYSVSAPSMGLSYFTHGHTQIKTVTGSVNVTSVSFTPGSNPKTATAIPYDESPAAVSSALTNNVIRVTAWGN